MSFDQITDHPNYEEIVSKIVTGTNSKDINQWLKVKYSDKDQKHLQLSAKLIQDFADSHIDLAAHLKKDLIAVKNGDLELSDYKIAASLLNNKTYRERLVELSKEEVDLKKLIQELVYTCKARMEQVFDKLQEDPTKVGKNDYVLLKYFEVLFVSMEKFDKIVNHAPDQVIQHNVTIQAVEQTTAVLQESIREALSHVDSEAALLFMEILADKLNLLKPPTNVVNTLENRTIEAQLLQESIIKKD